MGELLAAKRILHPIFPISKNEEEHLRSHGFVTDFQLITELNQFYLHLYGRVGRKSNSLCRYLKNMGVSVILVDEAGSVTGAVEPSSQDISYIADNIVFLRYLELDGELRKAIGVLKKRTSDFERSLREFEITKHGLIVGDPLSGLRGILQGTPERTRQFEERGERADGV